MFAVNFVAYNPAFYDAQFKSNDTLAELGITKAELNDARDKIINYLSGKTDKLELEGFFNESEISHMKDARAVFEFVRVLAMVLVVFGITSLVALFLLNYFTTSGNGSLWKGIIWGSGAFLGLAALVGLVALISWNGAFAIFHNIFFPQGNWQFSSDSAMITILPAGFFINAVLIIAGVGVGFAAVLGAAALVMSLRRRPLNPH